MGSKVLYVDNVTTDKYINKHSEAHKNSEMFTYVTFTDYVRETTFNGPQRHGDIFFNGDKITYLNDAYTSGPVTDGLDVFIPYVNDNYCMDVAYSGIRINYNGIPMNICSLYNIKSFDEISYEFIPTIGNYAVISEGTWKVYNDEDINILGGLISGSGLGNKTVNAVLSYEFSVDDVPCVAYAYINIYNITSIDKLEISQFPTKFAYGTLFTPRITNIEPDAARQGELHWESSNPAYVEILNSKTGMFRCLVPGTTANITCTYYIDANNQGTVTKQVNIAKIYPNLCISAYATTYLWEAIDPDDENLLYSNTTCYVNYDNCGFDNYEYGWALNGWTPNSGFSGYKYKSTNIQISDLNNSPMNVVRYILPEAYFYPNITSIQLYSPQYEPVETANLYMIPNTSNTQNDQENGLYSFIIVAQPVTPGQMVTTDYVFNTDGNLSNFTVTDITADGVSTYTYVTAQINSNALNSALYEMYREEASSYVSYSTISIMPSDASAGIYTSEPIDINYEKVSLDAEMTEHRI